MFYDLNFKKFLMCRSFLESFETLKIQLGEVIFLSGGKSFLK